MSSIKYVSIKAKVRGSISEDYELAVSKTTLRRLCERFTTQFCDYVLLRICDENDNMHEFEYRITDYNRDNTYFTVISRLTDLYYNEWRA